MDTAQTDQELLEKEFNTSTKAIHPNVSDASARVLGSKKLAKINISAILAGYDLGYNDYILGLKEGLVAMKFNELTGEKVPDYKQSLR